MNIAKKVAAAVLTLAMLLSFAGCHKKNEIAVTVGDVKFTSAYYMCALLGADAEAKDKVNESLTDDEKASGEEIDYYSHKVEDTEYEKWVKDTAIDSLKKIAAYKIICKEKGAELGEDEISQVESYASYYWSSYGYKEYFEPNGVSLETYTQYMKDSYYSNCCFDAIYGKGGEKELSAEDVKAKIYEGYILADVLNGSYGEDATDDSKAAIKDEFQGYVDEINSGKRAFRDIYIEYNKITDEQLEQAANSEGDKPQDYFATTLGSSITDNPSEHYDTVNALEMGKATLIELSDGTGVMLAVKQDIKADDYYLTSLDSSARHLIADEDFEKYIDKYTKDLKADVNKSATKQFKVKKIYEPETQNAATTTAAQ